MKKILLILASILFFSTVLHAGAPTNIYNNDRALQGVTESKAYFDVTIGDPKQLLIRLQLIEKTYNQLLAAGVTPSL